MLHPLQAHLVFYNIKYSPEEAEKQDDGLLVVAVFLEVLCYILFIL